MKMNIFYIVTTLFFFFVVTVCGRKDQRCKWNFEQLPWQVSDFMTMYDQCSLSLQKACSDWFQAFRNKSKWTRAAWMETVFSFYFLNRRHNFWKVIRWPFSLGKLICLCIQSTELQKWENIALGIWDSSKKHGHFRSWTK